MKTTIRWKRFFACALLLSLTWMLWIRPIDNGFTQNKTLEAVAGHAQTDDSLDLGGELPNPQRITAAQLHKLARMEVHTIDPHDSSKEIVYSGTPLVEVLKAAGLRLDSGMAGIRETVAMTVLVEASDGYRAVFALAELDPELTDRVILLADTRDGQPLSPREGPFRIIVPGEKRPARWVRQVRALTVGKN